MSLNRRSTMRQLGGGQSSADDVVEVEQANHTGSELNDKIYESKEFRDLACLQKARHESPDPP